MIKINNLIGKFKFYITSFLFLGMLFFALGTTIANAQEVTKEKNIFVFVREGCGACAKEEAFLKTIKDSNIKIALLDIQDAENYSNFLKITDKNKLSKVTPITLVGGEVLVGFDSNELTGKKIIDLADNAHFDIGTYLQEDSAIDNGTEVCKLGGVDSCSKDDVAKNDLEKIKVPVFGVINTKDFSLLSLSAIIGFVDGFNPCAMWVLVAFLIALSQVGSQLKMFIVAGLFIIAESVMYFLILNVWYKTWDFIKLDWLMLPLVGLLSLGGGIYFLYKFRKNKGQLVCDVTSLEHQRKTTTKIKNIATRPLNIFGAFVIIGLAFSVNIIEFACSVGLAQSFTKILELNNLSFWAQQWYTGVYTLFYMVDDFIVFGLAIFGYRKFYQFGAKYSNLALLIGGIILIILGILMMTGKNVFVF
ncbi:MAG: glutaredoxin [Parcubacteria group bacterium]|jgi:cytochrome c biogenesis protein CcdA